VICRTFSPIHPELARYTETFPLKRSYLAPTKMLHWWRRAIGFSEKITW
jgi:hypothetical protein